MTDDEAPSKLAVFSDTGLAVPSEDGKLDPREIVARVFERPFQEDRSIEISAKAPPAGSTKPTNVDIRRHWISVAGKVTPDMLLAIVASIIATSETSSIAVQRIRLEVSGWQFEMPDGSRG